MPFCPNCGGFAFVSKNKTNWYCKRGCGAGGILNPEGNIEVQMQAQYPNPDFRYKSEKNKQDE